MDSVKDVEQKKGGNYFFIDDGEDKTSRRK